MTQYYRNLPYKYDGNEPDLPADTMISVVTKGHHAGVDNSPRKLKDWFWNITGYISDIVEFTIVDLRIPEAPEVGPIWFKIGEYPPVGTLCEMTWGNKQDWFDCVILPDNHIASKKRNGSWSSDLKTDFDDLTFRPFRSEKEKVIKAALKVVQGGLAYEMYSALYDAGMLHIPNKESK